MRHAIIFAGVMGIILSMGNANAAFPADTASYPMYQAGQQTVGVGANAQTFAAGSIKDNGIKLATNKYVDTRANEVNTGVQTLSNTASTDNATVMSNKGTIENMESNRQVVAADPCANLAADEIACGYIVPEGTTTTENDAAKHTKANYNWVKIIATAETVAAENGSSGS